MKHLLIFCLLVLNPFFTYSQETLSIDFSNGETKEITIDYDDPTNLPKMGVDIKFFGLMFFHSEALSFKLSPYYRFNEKWMIKSNITMPYAKSTDANIDYRDKSKSAKLSHDWCIMNHYVILSKISKKLKKTAVDYSSSFVYAAKIPRIKSKGLSIDAGFGHIRYMVDGFLPRSSSTVVSDTLYKLRDFSSLSVNLGASLMYNQSYRITGSNRPRAYYRTSRFYGFFTFGLRNAYNVERYIKKRVGGNDIISETAIAEQGFVQPDNDRIIGYRIGYEKNFGIINSGNSFSFGIELGDLPTMKSKGIDVEPFKMANGIFMFHLGFGFGSKVSNKLPSSPPEEIEEIE